jgi:protein SCO1/2
MPLQPLMKARAALLMAALHALTLPALAQTPRDADHAREALAIPDIELVTQNGTPVHFYSDLVKGKAVVINFVFTSCTTVCPVMGVTFASLRKLTPDAVQLISVSVDPEVDTPARLKTWAARFDVGPRWTLVTGEKRRVDQLLKALKVIAADRVDHATSVLIGNGRDGPGWIRASGLAPAAKLAELAAAAQAEAALPPQSSAAARYFTDTTLVDQDGIPRRFYTDLLQNKVVVINVMFTGCEGACPVMTRTFARLQEFLGDRLGKDVHLLSISVDPKTDTAAKLKAYANGVNARPGWFFLSGSSAAVETVLGKLGQQVERREDHSNLFLIGNDRTGLWKKVFGMAAYDDILKALESVLNDRG